MQVRVVQARDDSPPLKIDDMSFVAFPRRHLCLISHRDKFTILDGHRRSEWGALFVSRDFTVSKYEICKRGCFHEYFVFGDNRGCEILRTAKTSSEIPDAFLSNAPGDCDM